ncbi:hypothetical protein F4780DRAFT_125020 [Xylariomycetidae sp. FL0641]|nr:hypothetical protein F4780DRAFT_125020 [Xylariomycetidae sp. FL0641]
MGLAAKKVKRKLDYDPNNTKWSRDETTFGQKILRAHGWEPGKFLGAQDSSHSHLLSAASSAPIKINLKDDTLGLGAKPRQKQNDECTGLVGFADLLGRLNGKSEETIKKEQAVRSELKTSLFVERRYGPMRFVSGGLLVGDQMKMTELMAKEPKSDDDQDKVKKEELSDTGLEDIKPSKKEKKSKKRKAEEPVAGETTRVDGEDKKKRKKRSKDTDSNQDDSESEKPKKKKKSKREDSGEADATDVTSAKTKKKSKKSKKSSQEDIEPVAEPASTEDVEEEKTNKKGKDKKDKKEKKEKKEKKRKQADATDASEITVPAVTSTSTPQESGTSTPAETGTSTPQALSNRHLSRSRNIASKRLAMADMAALNQIFMVKPV